MPFGDTFPQLYTEKVFDSGSKTMTTSNTRIAPEKMNIYGHILALIFSMTVTITKGSGTINTAKVVADGFNSIVIRDRKSKVVLDTAGDQLAEVRKLLSLADSPLLGSHKKGEYDAGTSLTDVGTAQVQTSMIPIDVNMADQPLSIEWKQGALADVLSTVGTATATEQLAVYSINVVPEQAEMLPDIFERETRRCYQYQPSAIATKKDIAGTLPTGVTIDGIAYQENSAGNDLTDITFKPTSENIGLESIPTAELIQIENRELWDGSTSGFFILPISPFVVGDATVFKINPTQSHTPRIYIVHRGVL